MAIHEPWWWRLAFMLAVNSASSSGVGERSSTRVMPSGFHASDSGGMVREATTADAAACAAIYAPYVTDTVVSFETEPPGPDEMAARIAAAHEWLVLEDMGRVVGYAYAGRFAPRAA